MLLWVCSFYIISFALRSKVLEIWWCFKISGNFLDTLHVQLHACTYSYVPILWYFGKKDVKNEPFHGTSCHMNARKSYLHFCYFVEGSVFALKFTFCWLLSFVFIVFKYLMTFIKIKLHWFQILNVFPFSISIENAVSPKMSITTFLNSHCVSC